MRVLALRGAITVDDDSAEEIKSRTIQLLETVYERNGLVHDDVISVLFTATSDITSAPPGVSPPTGDAAAD